MPRHTVKLWAAHNIYYVMVALEQHSLTLNVNNIMSKWLFLPPFLRGSCLLGSFSSSPFLTGTLPQFPANNTHTSSESLKCRCQSGDLASSPDCHQLKKHPQCVTSCYSASKPAACSCYSDARMILCALWNLLRAIGLGCLVVKTLNEEVE